MPTETFSYDTMITSDIDCHDVPIFQVEVAGKKGTEALDDKKLCLTSSWNLCYLSVAYGMEVGKDTITFLQMKKDRKAGVIECTKYPIPITGSQRGSKNF